MAIITLNSVRKSFGVFQILDEVSFLIGNDEKAALVGPNGSGKTTLLRLIAGMDEPDSGTINILPGTSIGYMRQDSELIGNEALLDEVSNASVDIKHLEKELRRLESAMSVTEGDEMNDLLAEYGEVQHEFERLGGYSFDAEIKATLSGLGLGPDHWEKPVSVLSGGQKTRAALAKLLLQKPDVLLLDEPTNHLDIEATEWLEDFLRDFPGAVLIVSHDRYFLDRVVTKIIDLHEACTRSYSGNYSSYVKQKEEVMRHMAENFDRQQQEVKKLEDFIARYHFGERHKEAESRKKKLAKMIRLRKPKAQDKIRVKIDSATTSGHIVMDIQDVGKSFGSQTLFTGLNLLVENGDRIAFVGPNGAGKTTLLRMILGDEEPSVGTISLGYGVDIGYFAQDLGDLDPDNTVLEEILEAEDLTSGAARSVLARFLFTGEDVFKSVAKLSGGERNRLILAKLMLQHPNVLVLDEPTNHLDIDSRQALDQAVQDFDGTVILTSHDRYLLNSVATRIVEINYGTARVYDGNYDYFVERSARYRPHPTKKKAKPVVKKAAVAARQKGPSAADYERDIEAAESRLGELADLLGNADTYADPDQAASTVAEYHDLQSRIEQLYADWEALID